nr:liprin-beta-2b isoform X2 [Pseudochaenichthys georgianus]
MDTEASHMLEAALEQMDDIIAGSKAAAVEFSNRMYEQGSPVSGAPLQLAEELKLALELQQNQEERDSLRAQLPAGTAQLLIDWLQTGTAKQCSAANHDTYQERLLRLEGDKESLVLQVSILTDQVKAQGEKIRDLESSLEEHRQKLASTEVMLQQDLLHEVKQLKREVEGLQGEKGQYERKLRATKADISELQQLLASKDAEIECLQTQLMARGGTADANTERDQEYQRLKAGMESLLASNGEKERRIEELTSLLGQYRKMREVMALTQGVSDEDLSGSSAVRAFTHKAHSDIVRSQMSSLSSSPFVLSSSPYQRGFDSSIHDSLHTSLLSTGDTSFCNGSWHQRRLLSSSLEELQSGSLQKDPHLELSRYQTLPGKLMMNKREQRARKHGDGEGEEDVSPGHCLQQEHYGLNQPEQLKECVLSGQSPLSSGVDSGQQSPVLPENRKSQRGIRKLWGKIRHSQSGSPAQGHDPELGELKRGGFRATAGPRLARSGNPRDLKMPFCKWSKEQVCDWLEEIGLGQYGVLACHWVTSGDTLLSSTMQDIEKEPAIKNPLHRKKLQLAMKTISSKQPDKSAELDYIWVTRWLDDIGLPQYKDQFSEGRVDGQMLQFLTVNELLFLKVTSQLHHLSLKSAIHVLHVNKFNSNCLKRRPSNQNQLAPSEVVQWSNHRVMEWLRSVDLAEYAPNLRGSGVHGGLLMLEPRFNPETLAMLLNIPPEKTLLRRHLTTNFNNLVGAEAHLEKKVYTEAVGNTPLSITAKVKPKKLGFTNLTHLRRRRPDESKDYVCPIALSLPRSGVPAVNDEVQVQP